MNKTFFARFALPILMLVFFMAPFALRGARMSFSTMKNDVKDWLPDRFEETKDLEWFRDNFLGEQFVLVTWPGCTSEDQRFQLFTHKLRNELQIKARATDAEDDQLDPAERAHRREVAKTREMGDRLGLATTGNYFENWGGRGEKWLQGDKDQWYFITPQGELVKWNGGNNLLGWAGRRIEQLLTGKNTATGEVVATVGETTPPGAVNEFYRDPRKLTARFFKTITTGPDVLERLAGPDGGLAPRGDYSDVEKSEIAHRLALDRLTGGLFGPDGKQTCMIVTLSDVGRRDLKRVLGRPLMGKPAGRLLQIATESGLAYEDLRLGGPPVDNVAIDEEGSITLVRLIGWSLLLGVTLAYLSFRSIKVTLMIFFVGGISAVISLSLVWYHGDFVDAIVMSMPSLVYVLGLSGSVHILTYYRHHCLEKGLEGASEATIAHTFKPIMLAQITSAIGLLSLLTSELLPIRKFGYYSALGVLATVVVMFLYMPSALQLWPPGYHKRRAGEVSAFDQWLHNTIQRFWTNWANFLEHKHYLVAPAMGLLLICVGFGVTRLKTNVHLLKMFDADAKIIGDYSWLEQNIGKLVPMELVVRVDPSIAAPLTSAPKPDEDEAAATSPANDLETRLVHYDFLERLEIVAHVQRAIESEFGARGQDIVGQGMSAVTFAPPLPEPGFGWRTARGVTNRMLEQHRDEFLHSDYLRIDKHPEHKDAELWRISLRLGALNDVDYGEFVNDIKCIVEPVIAACRHREETLIQLAQASDTPNLSGVRVAVIGLSDPAVYAEQESPAPKQPREEMAARPGIREVSLTAEDANVAEEVQPGKYGVHRSYQRDQERLFAQTFADLFENRGFKTTANAKNRLEFVDAAALTNADGQAFTAGQLADRLATYDVVVFAKELPACDLATVQQHAPRVVDARDFQFNPFGNDVPSAKRDDRVQVIYTGVVPVVYKAQRSLMNSLISSTNWAFVAISLCMMLLLRRGPLRPWNLLNVRGGMVSMLPNVFPLFMVFGTLGYLGVEIDIGSMMTASIAIGIAVDDTIHFLEWFRGGMKAGLTRHEAITSALQHCGSAMFETTLIAGLGLSVFAFSTFTPTQHFGLMMLTMLAVGLVGDLVWLPALLAGPLGKYFEPTVTPSAGMPTLATDAGELSGGQPSPKMQLDPPHTSRPQVRRDPAH